MEQKKEAFGRLLGIMDELREKCPWDRKEGMAATLHASRETKKMVFDKHM